MSAEVSGCGRSECHHGSTHVPGKTNAVAHFIISAPAQMQGRTVQACICGSTHVQTSILLFECNYPHQPYLPYDPTTLITPPLALMPRDDDQLQMPEKLQDLGSKNSGLGFRIHGDPERASRDSRYRGLGGQGFRGLRYDIASKRDPQFLENQKNLRRESVSL